MNVGELKKAIAKLPDDQLVVLAKDGEGNECSPLDAFENEWYDADSTYSGYTYADDDTDIPDSAVPAVVLYPVN